MNRRKFRHTGNRSYFFSDAHVDSSPADARAQFYQFLARAAEPDVTLVASVGDLWSIGLESSLDAMMANPACCETRDQLRQVGNKLVLLDGNHDPYSTLSEPDKARLVRWLGFPVAFHTHLYWQGIQVEHGHRMDPTSKLWLPILTALRKVVGVRQAVGFVAWVTKMWTRHVAVTPAMVKAKSRDAYTLMVPYIHDAYWRQVEGPSGLRVIITGHSHYDEQRDKPTTHSTFINLGDWTDGRGSYAVIHTDTGAAVLRKWIAPTKESNHA